MTSVCEIIVDSLSSLHSKLTSVLALDDELPSGPNRDICVGLEKQIKEILYNFTFLLPLSDFFTKWLDAKWWDSLLIKIQATIEEVAKKMKPEDADNVWNDTCEMVKKKGHQTATQDTPVLWECRGPNIRKRASELLGVLTNLNAKIDRLKPEIETACWNILVGITSQSHPLLNDSFDCKEFGWLVSSTCLCLSELGRHYATDADLMKVLDLRKNLRDLQIFLHGLPDVAGVEDVTTIIVEDVTFKIASVTVRALLDSCRWWARNLQTCALEDEVWYNTLFDQEKQGNISAGNPETLDQMLGLLKTLKATDHPLFDEKVIEFAQYVLPYWMGLVKFTKEIGSSRITISVKNEMKPLLPLYERNGRSFLLEFTQLISDIGKSFSCWSPEEGSLLTNLLANVCLMTVEDIIIQQIRYRGMFDYLLQVSETCKLRHIKESPQEYTENMNQILKFVEDVTVLLHDVPWRQFLSADAVVECSLLLQVQFFKLERELEDYNGSSKFSIKAKIQSFREWFEFLRNCFLSQRSIRDEVYEEACRNCEEGFESMDRTLVTSCNLLLTHFISEEVVQSMDHMLSNLLDEIKHIMARFAGELCLPVLMSNFPKTNALLFYDFLLSKLHDLMNSKADVLVSFKQYIEEILVDLQFFRNFLGDILGSERKTKELRDLCVHVIDVAYEAEYLIDSIVDRIKTDCQNQIWLYNLLQNIRDIRMQVSKIHKKKTCGVEVHNVPQTSRLMVSKDSGPRTDAVLSLNDQQELIINRLMGGYPQRNIVSIVGMPGIGKTTIAEKVYSSPTVAHHFHIRAWCCITEMYRKREVLLEILSHIIVLTENIQRMSAEDLESKLRRLLLKKKYLIVMDDVWSTEAWDDLQASLPENENGSRILITSRFNHVASKAKVHSDAHYLRLLSDAESWTLFQMKIFDEECCPDKLIEVGKKIAKNCKGLPLAIVAMAGILKRIDRQEKQWKEIAKNLSSQIVDDPEVQCRDILELSYKFLPDSLKACFLYFGAFLEDHEIPVTKLIRLWIAEGFVERTEWKSLEELAEDYLKDLIGRSLVISAQPRSRGGTKACRVHDMLRKFCLSKAKEDNFLQVITMCNEHSASVDDLDFLLNANFRNPSDCKTYEGHRLCFYSKRNYFIQSRPSGALVRSLLLFPTNDKYARSSYDISFIYHNFRRLKVLDLECINMGPSFPTGIELMAWLKYLAVSGDVESVPSSIAKLSNLETFVLRGLKGKVDLPDTFWCLTRLRHARVTDVAILNLERTSSSSCGSGNFYPLDCLVTLSSLFLPYGDDTNKMLRMFPNLRKLGCIFSESPNYYGSYNLFPRLDILTQLESLKIYYCGRALHAAEFSFPSSLKKLTLSNFRLPWSHISVIGRLQNLEVLKLLSGTYDGEIWDMVEGEFYNLKFLTLDNLNVAKWNASRDDLPLLEKLVLRNCKHLEEVPSSLVEISTLKMIEVKWCGESAEKAFRKMRDEADEFLNIIITSDLESL